VSPLCDKTSGQCVCRQRIQGRSCDEPLQLHYFPTLYQYQYEAEDGYTPTRSPVRFGYDQTQFPGFSWRGYAVFSQIQVYSKNMICVKCDLNVVFSPYRMKSFKNL
jgi:laminin alpha 3/5